MIRLSGQHLMVLDEIVFLAEQGFGLSDNLAQPRLRIGAFFQFAFMARGIAAHLRSRLDGGRIGGAALQIVAHV